MKNRDERVSPSGTSSDSTGLLQLLLAVAVGTVAALIVLPNWLPALAGSLVGTVPNAYWYFVRSSGFVAFGLLWLSMAMGLLITNKIARVWPNGPVAYDLHQFVSVLGLIFGFIHPVLMLGDQYTLAQIFVPFGGIQVRAVPVAMGQITLILDGAFPRSADGNGQRDAAGHRYVLGKRDESRDFDDLSCPGRPQRYSASRAGLHGHRKGSGPGDAVTRTRQAIGYPEDCSGWLDKRASLSLNSQPP